MHLAAAGIEVLGAVLALIPKFKAHAQPMGCGATVDFGRRSLLFHSSMLSAAAREAAGQFSYEASKAGKLGSYSRREAEWTFQSNSAKSEINQIFKQLRARKYREAIAKKEYDNHQVQMANAQQIIDFLQGNDIGPKFSVKETNHRLLRFMKRDLKGLYAKVFQLAFEVAKKAEQALQYELGDPSRTYIQFDYLDGNEGLLAVEQADVRSEGHGHGLSRPQPARVRNDQAGESAASGSSGFAAVACYRKLQLRYARGNVRYGWSGPLFSPRKVCCYNHSVRFRAFYQR